MGRRASRKKSKWNKVNMKALIVDQIEAFQESDELEHEVERKVELNPEITQEQNSQANPDAIGESRKKRKVPKMTLIRSLVNDCDPTQIRGLEMYKYWVDVKTGIIQLSEGTLDPINPIIKQACPHPDDQDKGDLYSSHNFYSPLIDPDSSSMFQALKKPIERPLKSMDVRIIFAEKNCSNGNCSAAETKPAVSNSTEPLFGLAGDFDCIQSSIDNLGNLNLTNGQNVDETLSCHETKDIHPPMCFGNRYCWQNENLELFMPKQHPAPSQEAAIDLGQSSAENSYSFDLRAG